jgi:hypothetical protein
MGKREGRKKPSTASGSNDGSLTQQLRALGLRVVPIQADGNCLFVRPVCVCVRGRACVYETSSVGPPTCVRVCLCVCVALKP